MTKTKEPIELTRPLLGWPDTVVTLTMKSRTNFKVTVESPVGVLIEQEPATGEEAMDVYYHPFAYGLEIPDIED